MRYEIAVEINAAPEAVWAVLADVERWPEWTASMARVQLLDGSTLAVGSRVRITQSKLPSLVWQVTEFDPPRSFSWTTTSVGVTALGTHRLTPNSAGGVTGTFGVRHSGLLAPLAGLFTAGLTRRYVQMEVQGLKRRCEATA